MWNRRFPGLRGLLILLAFPIAPLAGQVTVDASSAYSVRLWGVAEGLPQSTPTELALDREGFVWGGTYGGIFRFDGARLLAFGVAEIPFLQSNMVTTLAPAQAGGFWVATAEGQIGRVMDSRLVEELPQHPPTPESVFQLREGGDGVVWTWTTSAIHRYENGLWRSVSAVMYRSFPGSGLIPLGSDSILLGGEEGLALFVRGERRPYPTPVARLRSDPVQTVVPDAQGRLWIGLSDGVMLLPGEAAPALFFLQLGSPITHLVPKPDGGAWAVGPRGIWELNDRGGARFALAPPAQPLSVVRSQDGVLLVGMLGAGLMAILPRPVRSVPLDPSWIRSATGEGVHSVVSDGSGGFWVSSDCGPAARVQNGVLVEQVGGCLRSMDLDEEGTLWAGGLGTVVRKRPGRPAERFELAPPADLRPGALPPVQIRTVRILDERSVAVATDRGDIYLWDREDPSLPPRPLPGWDRGTAGAVAVLTGDGAGGLWIGQSGLVHHWTPTGVMRLGSAEGIPSGAIRILLRDPAGGLWIGGYGGGLVYRSPSGLVTPVTLRDTSISGLVLDPSSGSLWILQNQGIAVLGPEAVDQIRRGDPTPPAYRRLGEFDGVGEANNGSPAVARLTSGRLLFATLPGLVTLDPRDFDFIPRSVVPRITEIRAGERRWSFPAEGLRLTPEERVIEVDFSAPSLQPRDRIQYRYRLAGLDANWIDPGSQGVIQRVGVRPGRYRLELEARTEGGGWAGMPPISLEFTPLWWERATIRALLALGLFLALLGVFQLILEVQRQRARRLEERLVREAEQAQTAETHRRELAHVGRLAMAGELSASLTHEVSQPLTAIMQNVAMLQHHLRAPAMDPELITEVLDELATQGYRARSIVVELRRFLRSDQADRTEIDAQRWLEETEVLVRSELREHDVRLAIRVEDPPLRFMGERVLLQQVLINLLTNAIEASVGQPADRRTIRVRVRSVRSGVRVTVQDFGAGLTDEERGKLFEPFYSTREQGMGMGLPISRRVILAHRGWIRIRSRVGSGTMATFWIPST
jgi:signal transduction histidine kinase/ligand-binding sensor domain-containing protein